MEKEKRKIGHINMKKKIHLNQEVFDYFQPLTGWPAGYAKIEDSLILHYMAGKRVWGFDIETEGLNPYDKRFKIISYAISPEQKIAYGQFLLLDEGKDNGIQILKNIISNSDNILVGHNIKFDINWLSVKYDIKIKCMLFDTMFAQYLINENIESNSLGELSKLFTDLGNYKDEVNRSDLKRMAKDDVLIYNCKDADASRRLYDYFVPKLKADGYDKLMTTASLVLPILSKMETRGVYLDKEYANKTQNKLFKEMVSLRYSMVEICGKSFNPDSPQSLSKTLYNHLGFTATKFTDTGQGSTDSEAIGYLIEQANNIQQQTFISQILEYKKKLKLITTYYQPIERWTKYDGKVHTNYSLGKQRNEESSGGTVTGRLSSNNPNLQNIPRGKDHRGMFCASPGYVFLDGDFSQLELRVAAYLSQEPVMMDAFNNGLDIHTAVMSDLQQIPYSDIVSILKDDKCKEYEKTKNDRVAIKRVNFGILYGVQAKRLQRLLRIELGIQQELDYCQELIRRWLSKYAKMADWIKSQKIQAASYGFVSMPLGQRRRLPEASFEKTREAAHALAQATNFPVQSLASWICLIGLILLDNYFDNNEEVEGHPVLCVHDSITTEVKIKKPNWNIFELKSVAPSRQDRFIELSNQSQLESIKKDVKRIMEQETLNYLREVFGIKFNCPLIFDIKLQERWS